MTFTRSDKTRTSKSIVYTANGQRGSVRISKELFADKTGPAKLTSLDELNATPKIAKAKMTKEERKAHLATLPKLTDAQNLAKLEARTAALRAKMNVAA